MLGNQRGYLLKDEKVIVGVDTGGTFTDFIYKDGDRWKILKILSTPNNPAEAVLEGLNKISKNKSKDITHGSTVATNTVLERKGAVTGFITNKGFEDIAYIGRQNRKELYNLTYRRKKPLYKKSYGIECRVLKNGKIEKDIDLYQLEALITELKRDKIQSVAVCFLFSFINPEHENTVKEYLEREGFYVSVSHEIVPEFREYERASTTIVNGYVLPKMRGYISYLEKNISDEDKLRVMQSNGGVISTFTVKREPVRTILSGPAGGVVGALEIGKLAGFTKLITFDMGGTSTDVSLIDGKLSISTEAEIEDFPIKVPMIDIHTVGAGGGSIAYIDRGGSLNVGPESAGADPGPICYGKGDRITITDANLFLGRLIPEYFLGGGMKLYPERLEPFFRDMAYKLGISPIELAEGILEIGNIKMEKALRKISIERGYNPSDFTLFSFGGAGGLHSPFLARMLGIPQVLVPKNPGILSAMGMLLADIIKDYSLTVMQTEDSITYKSLSDLFKILEEKAIRDLNLEGINDIRLERYLDIRYKGQSFELMIPFDKDFTEKFHMEHKKIYGYENRKRKVEVVNIRLRAIGKREKPNLEKSEEITRRIPDDALLDEREVIFEGKPYKTKIFDRDKLKSGNVIEGGAILVEYSSTIVIPPFAEGEIDRYKNLIIRIKD